MVAPAFQATIPTPLTPLIGRESEVASACALLRRADVRLLTFSGPGGVGKTRLALSVVAELEDAFADGVALVWLASISDAQFVLSAVARALDVQESADQPLLDALIATLAGKRVLMLLDNLEHIVRAASELVTLLEGCPLLKMLVTSREVLRVRGEYVFTVPPLGLPNLDRLTDYKSLSSAAAVRLFVQRGQAVKADFQLTRENAYVIAEICIHLDGLALALELAAARLRMLSPSALLARLEHRLQILTLGSREVAARQQTLRNALQWSYDLLSPQEQGLFRCLAVFRGGWTLESACAVCVMHGNGTVEIEEGLTSLFDKSLLRQRTQLDGEIRFSLLATIREYAWERLEELGEVEAMRRIHAKYYTKMAEEAEQECDGPRQVEYLQRLEEEHDNLRDALRWTLEQPEPDLALRLSGALRVFWSVQCFWSEGRAFLEQALARSDGNVSSARAKALRALAVMLFYQNDCEQSVQLAEESLALYNILGDTGGIIRALNTLGPIVASTGNYRKARALTEESVALAREMGDRGRMAQALTNLGQMASIQGEYSKGRSLLQEALGIQRELGNTGDVARSLYRLAWLLVVSRQEAEQARIFLEESLLLAHTTGDKELMTDCLSTTAQLALNQGDIALARSLLEESLALSRAIENEWTTAGALSTLARLTASEGDFESACTLYVESFALCQQVGDKELVAMGLESLADVGTTQGEVVWAVTLWGAAAALRDAMGTPIIPGEQPGYEQMVAQAHAQLGAQAYSETWEKGRKLTPQQALAAREPRSLAQESVVANAPMATRTPAPGFVASLEELSEREREVLRLVAQGMTNAQIGERLVISPHTANSHVRSILSKLGMTSRSAIIRFAFEHHLVSG